MQNPLKALREWLDAAEAEESNDEAEAEAETEAEDEAETEAETETEAEDEAEAETEHEDEDPEGTPGTQDEGSAEVADLKAQIISQASMIETLRNKVAELGGEDPTETDAEEIEDEDEPTEDEVVDAFETDYAERKARLAEIQKGE